MHREYDITVGIARQIEGGRGVCTTVLDLLE